MVKKLIPLELVSQLRLDEAEESNTPFYIELEQMANPVSRRFLIIPIFPFISVGMK